jgi:polyribonucleotide nucleotidyltransferase
LTAGVAGTQVILTTACYDDAIAGDGSFTPLMIVHAERKSAAGRTSYAPLP